MSTGGGGARRADGVQGLENRVVLANPFGRGEVRAEIEGG